MGLLDLYCSSSAAVVIRKCLSVTFYVHCLLVSFSYELTVVVTNIQVGYMHTRLTVHGVLKYIAKKGDS
jgi:hypothetical protein